VKLVELMAFSPDPNSIREANQPIEQLLSSCPDHVEGLKLLAITEWRLGKAEDAEKHLRQALAKVPDHLQSLVTLAWIKFERKDAAEAERLLKAGCRAGGWFNRARTCPRAFLHRERNVGTMRKYNSDPYATANLLAAMGS
jgi:cytochrome c-type biogenesis protein CcmH/NrfG